MTSYFFIRKNIEPLLYLSPAQTFPIFIKNNKLPGCYGSLNFFKFNKIFSLTKNDPTNLEWLTMTQARQTI